MIRIQNKDETFAFLIIGYCHVQVKAASVLYLTMCLVTTQRSKLVQKENGHGRLGARQC